MALPDYLAGQYLTFSMAWSSLTVGRMIFGGLTLRPDAAGGLHAVYEERLPGGELVLEGPLQPTGRGLGAMLRHTREDMFIFLLLLCYFSSCNDCFSTTRIAISNPPSATTIDF